MAKEFGYIPDGKLYEPYSEEKLTEALEMAKVLDDQEQTGFIMYLYSYQDINPDLLLKNPMNYREKVFKIRKSKK